MTNFYKSEIHKQVIVETLERYKQRPEGQLIAFRGIYNVVREDAIKRKDSRWKIPQEEGKLSVKEHIKLINLALDSKKPIVIGCKPAILGVDKPK